MYYAHSVHQQVALPAAKRAGAAWLPGHTRCRHRLTKALPRREHVSRASAAPATQVSVTDDVDVLQQWLTQQGLLQDKLPASIETSDGATILIASRQLNKGETAIIVPENNWLTPKTAQSSPLGPYIRDLEGWLQIALFILHERQQVDSAWAPYLRSFAARPSVPAFWTDDQLTLIERTQLAANLQNYLQFFASRHQQLQETVFAAAPTLFPREVFTLDALVWAACTVRSRVHVPLEGDKVALVPLADLVAHSSKASAGQWVLKSGLFGGSSLVWEAGPQGAPQGAPLTINFGADKLDNQLLLDYGVLDPDQDNAGFALTLEIPDTDRYIDDKADILTLAKLAEQWTFTLRPDQAPEPNMMAFLRLLHMQGADAFLLEALFRNEVWDHLQEPISEDNERAVCEAMIQGCRVALSEYPTSIDEDLALLRSGMLQPASIEEMAVRVRLGEKEAIDTVSQYFEARVEQLGSLEYYAERRLKRLGLLDDTGRTTYDSFFEDGVA